MYLFARNNNTPCCEGFNISKFQFDREFESHGFVSRKLLGVTLVKQSLFIYLFVYLKVCLKIHIWDMSSDPLSGLSQWINNMLWELLKNR